MTNEQIQLVELYHVTYEDLGEMAWLKPRLPLSEAPGEERETPRICVAPRIADCLRLFAWLDYQDEVHVYKVVAARHLKTMSAEGKTPDWEKGTKEEMWVLEDAPLRYLGKVKMYRPPLVFKRNFWTWTVKAWEVEPQVFEMTPKEVEMWKEHERRSEEVIKEMNEQLAKEMGGKS